jgi:hypothetical protein
MGISHVTCAVAICLLLSALTSAGTFGRIEARFELPDVKGNPFDFEVNDVRVTLASPDGKTITLPAFFDGGTTWRVRHAPTAAGKWTIQSVTLSGADAKPQKLDPGEFDVRATPTTQPAAPETNCYVRIDPKDKMRFAYDDGTPYYPIGYDLAWHHKGEPKMPPLVESLARMNAAGVNWTRIWMNVWDGKNLDWSDPTNTSPKLGDLSLDVAKHWDDIVSAAEVNGVRFQLVLQHHGQYSSTVNENWTINPWNTANGGFLADPKLFFTDEKARKLTRAKYRYIVARWGYSPSIMAWELFNEVEFVDAYKTNLDDVAAWHAEMAKFLREHDAYKHLITTSSHTGEPPIWPAMDYYNDHVYAPDLVTAVQTLESKNLDKPYFYGEIGSNAFGVKDDVGETIHKSLWASLMSNSAGGAMYWYWYEAEPRGLLFHYTAAQAFLKASNLPARGSSLKPMEVIVDTGSAGPFKFGPGSGWAPSKGTSFNVKRSCTVEGLGGMSAYLQGKGENAKMFPFAELSVDYEKDGIFAVRVDEMTPAGATLNVSVDGKPAASLTLPPPPAPPTTNPARERRNPRVDVTLEVSISAGKHMVRLENNGADWIHLREFTLTPYAPQLATLGKGTKDYAVMWVYRRDAGDGAPVSGTLAVPGLDAGEYRVAWWDTTKRTPIREDRATVAAGMPLSIPSGPVATDVAICIERADTKAR